MSRFADLLPAGHIAGMYEFNFFFLGAEYVRVQPCFVIFDKMSFSN